MSIFAVIASSVGAPVALPVASAVSTPDPGSRLSRSAGEPAVLTDAYWIDLDGNPWMDLLATDAGGRLRILGNRGDGEFEDRTESLGLPVLLNVAAAAWADFDGDGPADLLVGTVDAGVRLFLRTRGASFVEAANDSGLSSPRRIASIEPIDFDRDGATDVLIRGYDTGALYHNLGAARFESILGLAPLVADSSTAVGEVGALDGVLATDRAAAADRIPPGLAFRASPSSTAPEESTSDAEAAACSRNVLDQAGGPCIRASSTPALGQLYPLSSNLCVTPEGNLGVGTTAPVPDVDLQVLRASGHSLVRVTNQGPHGLVAGFQVEKAGAGLGWTFGTGAEDYGGLGALGFRSFPGRTAMVLEQDGKVGIGTDAPVVALHVVRNSSAEAALRVSSTGPYGEAAALQIQQATTNTGWSLGTGSNDFGGVGGLGFRTFGGTTTMVLQQGGNVGIGTTSPTARLDVAGETATHTLRIRGGGDIVEGFEVCEQSVEPGTVMSIDPERAGSIRASSIEYDTRVAGVVSGAGGVRAGLELGQEGVLDGSTKLAMAGRVYVKCSAENGAIAPGDLLTTSSTVGHAMKATDSARVFGSVIGKAMTPLAEGSGLVLALVNLQ